MPEFNLYESFNIRQYGFAFKNADFLHRFLGLKITAAIIEI